jgi:hypothetical protein
MKYVVELGSGSSIQNLMEGGDTQTYRQHGDLISLLQESRLKRIPYSKEQVQLSDKAYHWYSGPNSAGVG